MLRSPTYTRGSFFGGSSDPITTLTRVGRDARGAARTVASSRARRIASSVLIVAVAFPLVLLHIRVYPTFSAVDEVQHFDYMTRVMDGNLLRPGDTLLQSSLHGWACRGIDAPWGPPPCQRDGERYDPAEFPLFGLNYHWDHPPLYYLLTGVVAETFLVLGVPDPLVAARLANALWLGIGLLLLTSIARRMGIPLSARFIIVALLIATPSVLHLSAIVNNDSMALLTGSIILATALSWEADRRWLALLPIAGAFAVAVKGTNIVGVLAVAGYLFFRGIGVRGSGSGALSRYTIAAGSLVAGGVLAGAAWILLRPAPLPGFVDPFLEHLAVDTPSVGPVLSQLGAFITPIREPWITPFFERGGLLLAVTFHWVLLAGCVVAFVQRSRDGRIRALAAGGIVGLVVGAGVVATVLIVFRGLFFPIWARYGLAALPLLLIPLGAAMTWRPMWIAAAGTATATVVVVTTALLVA